MINDPETVFVYKDEWVGKDIPLPTYSTDGASGLDLRVVFPNIVEGMPPGEYELKPNERTVMTTGLRIRMPKHLEAQVRSRSGLAAHYGIIVLNSPGTIDSDYSGLINVILYNTGQSSLTIKHGMRIAQLVFAPVTRIVWKEVTNMSASTLRGDKGLGSTGIN